MAREIIKQETVFLWIGLCVAIGLPLLIVDSIVVWLLHDCWPLQTYGSCFALVPRFEWHLLLVFVPAFLGGTLVAWWLRKRTRPTQTAR